MTLFYFDDAFYNHIPGAAHPECAARLDSIKNHLQVSGLWQKLNHRNPSKPLPLSSAAAVHTLPLVEKIQETLAEGGGYLDSDTPVTEGSLHASLLASSALCESLEALARGEDKTAFCCVRPPGHHATTDTSMGFCLMNHVAIAARHAQKHLGMEKILILDWDVHHGNGTQEIFYHDPSVFFLSLHRFPFYPGTGSASEVGEGKGRKTTLNIPLEAHTQAATYQEKFLQALEMIEREKFSPDLILLSAGFDAHKADPVGGLGLEEKDYLALTKTLKSFANTHAQGLLACCLEGGYNLKHLGPSVGSHLEGLLT